MEAPLQDINDEIPRIDNTSKSMRDFLYSEIGSSLYYKILNASKSLSILSGQTKDILISAELSDSEHPGDIIERHMNSIRDQERKLLDLYKEFEEEYQRSIK